MINLTDAGHAAMMRGMTQAVRGLHLYVADGELQGYNYAPKQISPDAWDGNQYPKQTWTFAAGEETRVLGYYVTGEDGAVLWSREFPQDESRPGDYVIGREDDRIGVQLTFGLLMGNQ